MRGAIAAIAIVTFIELTASGQTHAAGDDCRQVAQVLGIEQAHSFASASPIGAVE